MACLVILGITGGLREVVSCELMLWRPTTYYLSTVEGNSTPPLVTPTLCKALQFDAMRTGTYLERIYRIQVCARPESPYLRGKMWYCFRKLELSDGAGRSDHTCVAR